MSNIRHVAPAVLAFLLLIPEIFYYPFAGMAFFFPMLVVTSIFYWSLYRPDLFPKWLIFIIGMVQDASSGTPLGITSLAYLLLWWALMSQRKHLLKQPFPVVWGVFSIGILLLFVVQWLAMSLYYLTPLPITYSAMQVLFTIFIYPLMHYFYASIWLSLFR